MCSSGTWPGALAMPLVARDVGLHLISQGRIGGGIPDRHQLVCADAFALAALGPGVRRGGAVPAHLDPGVRADGEVASDPVRAELLLQTLPEMAPPGRRRDDIAEHTELLRAAWGTQPAPLSEVRTFLHSGRRSTWSAGFSTTRWDEAPELPYDMNTLGTRSGEAGALVRGEGLAGTGKVWDILVSMWWARVSAPDSATRIDRQARAALDARMNQRPSSSARFRASGPVYRGRT